MHWGRNCLCKKHILTVCLNWHQMILWVTLHVLPTVRTFWVFHEFDILSTILATTTGWRHCENWRTARHSETKRFSLECHWICFEFINWDNYIDTLYRPKNEFWRLVDSNMFRLTFLCTFAPVPAIASRATSLTGFQRTRPQARDDVFSY